MDDISPPKINYIKNTPISDKRTLRVEVVGGVEKEERHFLDGVTLFAAGTLSKGDLKHTTYVSELMSKLIKFIVDKLRETDKGDK